MEDISCCFQFPSRDKMQKSLFYWRQDRLKDLKNFLKKHLDF